MPNWLWVVLIIIGVLVAGMIRERWRLRAMEGVATRRGLTLHSPFTPGDRPPMTKLAELLEGRRITRWGAGVTGAVDGLEIAIAEHEVPASGGDATGSMNTTGIWHVMLAWPVGPGGNSDAGAPWPHGGKLAGDGEWAAWRLRGNLTESTVEFLLAHLPEARQRFAPAGGSTGHGHSG